MITRLLVANRGEIARRVFATCRRLGIETVAVHSDADAALPFVREATVAVRLPGNTPAETYLDGALVLDAARRTGADAIHPGYGFLSENAAFARAVLDAGLTWVGPSPESIDAMGSKVRAKELMREAGVPVLEAPDEPTDADLPLLVKASAGGGGRGMRVVRSLARLENEVTAAAAEAESAFGDPAVFVEPYVESGRHVEVQVVGDSSGQVLVLGERDCSIQRRHQKVVEEAPAPDLDRAVVEAMHSAAQKAAEAIGYVGAGTVEFLFDPSTDRFFFLEMNTRLQVEHPVTEAVFAVDLVELQVRVAEGRASALAEITATSAHHPRGHAIEVRLYAEDPASEWQPQSGLLTRFEIPHDEEFRQSARGIRVDSGFENGSEVSTYYDAMLAKVIAWAPSRAEAARMLAGALARARLHGVVTNRDLLVAILRDPDFLAGRVSTDFLQHDKVQWSSVPGTALDQGLGLFAAAVAVTERASCRHAVQSGVPSGWRNVVSAAHVTTFEREGTRVDVGWYGGREGYRFADVHGQVEGGRVIDLRGGPDRWTVVVEHDEVERSFEVSLTDERADVDLAAGHLALRVVPRFVDPADAVASGSLLAPMPGSVVQVAVEDGATVSVGDAVLVLEAMKMQHTISAPTDGVVSDLVGAGTQVAAGDVLAVVSNEERES